MKGDAKGMAMLTGYIAICGTAAVLLMESPPAGGQSVKQPRVVEAKVIEASRIVLKDARGRVRGIIGIDEDGQSGFAFKDAKGTVRAHVEVAEDGQARLGICRKDGKDAVALVVTDSGGAGLDVSGRHDVVIAADPEGAAAITLRTGSGETKGVWQIGSDGRVSASP